MSGRAPPRGASVAEERTTLAQELAAAKAELLQPEGGAAAAEPPKSPAAAPAGDTSRSAPTSAAPTDAPAASSGSASSPADPAKPAAADSLTKRLALLAAEGRKLELARQELEQRKPDLERLAKIRGAKSKVDAIKELFGGDEEAVAQLFIELDEYHRADPKQRQTVSDEERLDALLEKKLAARDQQRQQQAAATLQNHRQNYVTVTMRLLEARGDDFPLCSIGLNPDDITAISEGAFEATGKVPSPEEVLRAIESTKQTLLDKRLLKKPETKPAGATAPEPGADKRIGPVRNDDVPVTPPRRTTYEEELELAKREAGIK